MDSILRRGINIRSRARAAPPWLPGLDLCIFPRTLTPPPHQHHLLNTPPHALLYTLTQHHAPHLLCHSLAQTPAIMADKKTSPPALSAPSPAPQPTASPAAILAGTPAQRSIREPKLKDSKPKDLKSKDSKPREPKPAKDTKPQPMALAAADGSKLTAKQLKEQKKAEKAARRADTRAATGVPPPQQTGPQKGEKNAAPATQANAATAATGGGIVKTIYPTNPAAVVVKEVEVIVETGRDNGLVGLLKNLAVEQQDKKKAAVFGIGNAHPDVHPAILTLGMQINQYVLVGSTARCLGFLLAMKRVYSVMRNHSLFWF